MSICESTSSQSSDQSSESSASSGISKTSPELRLRPKSTSEKSAHLSCPDLETMVTKNSSQCMTIPNRAIEPKKNVSETDSEDPGKVSFSRKKIIMMLFFREMNNNNKNFFFIPASPLLNRRRKLHGGEVLPKFSISMEDSKTERVHRYVRFLHQIMI